MCEGSKLHVHTIEQRGTVNAGEGRWCSPEPSDVVKIVKTYFAKTATGGTAAVLPTSPPPDNEKSVSKKGRATRKPPSHRRHSSQQQKAISKRKAREVGPRATRRNKHNRSFQRHRRAKITHLGQESRMCDKREEPRTWERIPWRGCLLPPVPRR